MPISINLRRGDRCIIVGKSGSGKTTLALELARTMPLPLVIVDTKWSASIAKTAGERGWRIVEGAFPETLEGVVIWRPDALTLSDPGLLDAPFASLVERRKPCSVYFDELYPLHTAGRAGPGLVGLFTRGREMGFTTLGGAQRPSWVSLFCLTEANIHVIMRLDLPQDRKRMAAVTGYPEIANVELPNRYFWYIEEGDEPTLVEPITPGQTPKMDVPIPGRSKRFLV